jgi:hypothetical protein
VPDELLNIGHRLQLLLGPVVVASGQCAVGQNR